MAVLRECLTIEANLEGNSDLWITRSVDSGIADHSGGTASGNRIFEKVILVLGYLDQLSGTTRNL